ncbi:cell division protein FtsA [Weissella coleopterorum]|uniref:Cell division protein FtsA n=1 Tax=Weissella coleopterorum TaxID=2714949 RepID=A0A6G8AZL9_9LACO|nr:cell division protein FtsA [Weissella coleopterorum]QIL50541.1 cell division protein FtsA [Weissella coleopterorum]
MANHGVIVGLDVGTSTVKVLVADVRDQQVNVIAVGRSISHGVKRGMVVDIDAAAQDIQAALSQVKEQTNQDFTEVIASIPANAIQMRMVRGTVTSQDSQHISYQDVIAATKSAINIPLEHDQAVLDLTGQDFTVDDLTGVLDPNDMVGSHLTLNATAYVGPRLLISNLRSAIERAGLNLRDLVLAPLAASQTIATDAEQEFGTILLDLGAGQTTATIVQNHQIKFISTYGAGGANITKDIGTVLSISNQDAEQLKLDAGVAAPQFANEAHLLTVNPVGKKPIRISELELSEIIGARMQQIVTKLGERLDTVSAFQLPGGMIVSGGSATLRHTQDILQAAYGINAKLFMPHEIGLQNPAFVGSWALVNYAAQQTKVALIVKQAMLGIPITVEPKTIVAPKSDQYIVRKTVEPNEEDDMRRFRQTGPESSSEKASKPTIVERLKLWFSELFN